MLLLSIVETPLSFVESLSLELSFLQLTQNAFYFLSCERELIIINATLRHKICNLQADLDQHRFVIVVDYFNFLVICVEI